MILVCSPEGAVVLYSESRALGSTSAWVQCVEFSDKTYWASDGKLIKLQQLCATKLVKTLSFFFL